MEEQFGVANGQNERREKNEKERRDGKTGSLKVTIMYRKTVSTIHTNTYTIQFLVCFDSTETPAVTYQTHNKHTDRRLLYSPNLYVETFFI